MSTQNFFSPETVPIQSVRFEKMNFDVLRLDKIHAGASGNKFFKLKHNFIEAEKNGHKRILTFGGAFSNHIAATAISAKACGFESVGIIRGEEVSNPTLDLAEEQGMKLHFISREEFRKKDEAHFLKEMEIKFDHPYIIPEGGTNALATRGTAEIHQYIPKEYQLITTCFGTGGTIAGLIKGKLAHQTVLGFSVLKGEWPEEETQKLLGGNYHENWQINTEYHFGGYAKWKPELIEFIQEFYSETSIPLDPIYTGKMMFGLISEIKKDKKMDRSKILAIHSGGLQGIQGFNERFGFELPDF